MGGRGKSADYREFRAKTPTTSLKGTEKQVAWAKDIREGIANTMQSYYDATKADLREKIDRYSGSESNLAKVRVRRAQEKLSSLPKDVRNAMGAIGKVTDAKWFIDNRSPALMDGPIPMGDIRTNRHGAREGAITAGGDLMRRLKRGGYM